MADESISVELSRHVIDIIGFIQRGTGQNDVIQFGPFSFPELQSFWSAAGIESSGWFQFAVRKLWTSGLTVQSQMRNSQSNNG